MPLSIFAPKLPVSDSEREWVDEGFSRLERMLGRRRMLDATVVLPDPEHFPDVYDKTPAAVEKLFQRICAFMRVDHRNVELEIFPDEGSELRDLLPYWSGKSNGCAGVYLHKPTRDEEADEREKPMVIAVKATQVDDPLALVATIAHELGHVILLGGGLLSPDAADHEPMTDLLTVFLGLGIFSANSAARFRQYQDERSYGWSMQRLGYLPQEVYGYALAKFVAERGENKPRWTKHLCTNVLSYYKRSSAWLARNAGKAIMPDPIG